MMRNTMRRNTMKRKKIGKKNNLRYSRYDGRKYNDD